MGAVTELSTVDICKPVTVLPRPPAWSCTPQQTHLWPLSFAEPVVSTSTAACSCVLRLLTLPQPPLALPQLLQGLAELAGHSQVAH